MGNQTGGREQWGSRLGFVLAAAGSAVGLGNIWKFPFITGMYGGAAFVLFYLISILIIGLPVMLIEFSIGRKTQLNPVGAFKTLAPDRPYFLIGALGVLAGFVILSYYSVVAGWTVAYIIKAISGNFHGFQTVDVAVHTIDNHVGMLLSTSPDSILWGALPDSLAAWDSVRASIIGGAAVPDSLLSIAAATEFMEYSQHSWLPIISHAVFMFLIILIVSRGVKKGIEKWNNILMPTLLVIIIMLVVRGITLPGSQAGLSFLFAPDFSKLDGNAMLVAMGHAFFTLSLGMGAMLTYGSYLSRKENLVKSALWIIVADTGVALLAGVAIFTTVFAMGFEPNAGPGLVFHVLPAIFAMMPGGYLMGILFFVLLTIAAITSGMSLLEVVTAYFIDQKGWSRRKTTSIFGFVIFLLGIPSALSFGILSEVTLFDMTLFDFFDYLSFKYMLPLGGLLMVLFTIFRWKSANMLAELRIGGYDLKIRPALVTALLALSAIFVTITFIFGIWER